MKNEPLKEKKALLGYKFKRNKTTDEPEFGFYETDVKSAIRGFEHELINDYMGDELPFINIHVKKFSKLAKKWFSDAIVNDTKERVK